MKGKISSRALLAGLLAALMLIAFLPAWTYTSLAASGANKVTKVTKANYTKNKSYAKSAGAAVTLKYKLSPSGLASSAKKVTWKASDNNIVSISNIKSGSARVTFKAAGSVKVTVKSRQNSRAKVTWKFRVLSAEETQRLTGISVTSADSNQSVRTSVMVGDTLEAAARPEGATADYQWYVNGQAIEGATGTHYNPSEEDVGKRISVKATGTGSYTGTSTFGATARVIDPYAGSDTPSPTPTTTVIGGTALMPLTLRDSTLEATLIQSSTIPSASIEQMVTSTCRIGDLLTVSTGNPESAYKLEWYLESEEPDEKDQAITVPQVDGGYVVPSTLSREDAIYAVAVGQGKYAGSRALAGYLRVMSVN